jgi:hypothetical protein
MFVEGFVTLPISSGLDLSVNRIDLFAPLGLISRVVSVSVCLSLERRDLAYAGDVSHWGQATGHLSSPGHVSEYNQADDVLSGNGPVGAHFQLDHCDLSGETSGTFEYFDAPLIPNTFDGTTHLERAGIWSVGDVTSGSWNLTDGKIVHGVGSLSVPAVVMDSSTDFNGSSTVALDPVGSTRLSCSVYLICSDLPSVPVLDPSGRLVLSPSVILDSGRCCLSNSIRLSCDFRPHPGRSVYLVLVFPRLSEGAYWIDVGYASSFAILPLDCRDIAA